MSGLHGLLCGTLAGVWPHLLHFDLGSYSVFSCRGPFSCFLVSVWICPGCCLMGSTIAQCTPMNGLNGFLHGTVAVFWAPSFAKFTSSDFEYAPAKSCPLCWVACLVLSASAFWFYWTSKLGKYFCGHRSAPFELSACPSPKPRERRLRQGPHDPPGAGRCLPGRAYETLLSPLCSQLTLVFCLQLSGTPLLDESLMIG